MKFKQIQKKLLLNAVVFIFLLTGANIFTAAIAGAATCFNAVQNKIAYDYKGHKRWSPANIKRLCRSAERSREPAVCFNRVMHGGVNYGGGTKWQWKNALNLCKGSKNANATIACFERKVNRGRSWQTAIKNCNHLSSPVVRDRVRRPPPPVVRDHRRPPPVVRDRVRRPPPPVMRDYRTSGQADAVTVKKLSFSIPGYMQKKLKTIQWTIGGRGKGRVVESGGFYSVINLVNNRGIKAQTRAVGAGLGFLDASAEGNNVKILREKGAGIVRYGDVVALRVSHYGWLRYQHRERGINLDGDKKLIPQKNFIWRITGGKRGTQLLTGMPFALYQAAVVHSETIYCKRTYSINLAWYDYQSSCNTAGSWVSNKVFGENGAFSGDGYAGIAKKKLKSYLCRAAVDAAATALVATTSGTSAVVVAAASELAVAKCKKL